MAKYRQYQYYRKEPIFSCIQCWGKIIVQYYEPLGVSADVKFSSEGGTMGTDNANKTVDRIITSGYQFRVSVFLENMVIR